MAGCGVVPLHRGGARFHSGALRLRSEAVAFSDAIVSVVNHLSERRPWWVRRLPPASTGFRAA